MQEELDNGQSEEARVGEKPPSSGTRERLPSQADPVRALQGEKGVAWLSAFWEDIRAKMQTGQIQSRTFQSFEILRSTLDTQAGTEYPIFAGYRVIFLPNF